MPKSDAPDVQLWDATVKLNKFHQWADRNPDVIRWLWNATRSHVAAHGRTSIKRLFEQARYDEGLRIADVDGEPKLSNSHSAIAARVLVSSVDGADGIFRLRPSVFDVLDADDLPRINASGALVWPDAS